MNKVTKDLEALATVWAVTLERIVKFHRNARDPVTDQDQMDSVELAFANV